ncbi:Phenylalanine--tRNA ligase alpha subunit [uncultured archaeon]|nr:Phenylalanine--tRNA ligase alpha subunit [uncultured archaeon]
MTSTKGSKTAGSVDISTLHQNDRSLLTALIGKKGISLQDAARAASLNPDSVMRSAFTLSASNLLLINESKSERLVLTDEGKRFLENRFPEQRVLDAAEKHFAMDRLSEEEKKVGVAWASRLGWVKVSDGKLQVKSKPQAYGIYDALKLIGQGKAPDKASAEQLVKRGSAALKVDKSFSFTLTPAGESAAKGAKELIISGTSGAGAEVNELTHEMLSTGSWKEARFRKYNTSAPVETASHGAAHPISAYVSRIQQIFLNMGFEEATGNEVESSFWNFDALFTPQDHPARELHDTFYLKQPGYVEYPKDVAERVKEVQEKNWKYSWNPSVAEQAVLRTHTTCISGRKLAELGKKRSRPAKFFAIGRVYRNEATDFKHLAEFYQVEGIVAWKRANFRHLLGVLSSFYGQLGMKVRFRPHYFPYTEPSLEVDRWDEGRNQWIELAGAGILRPEVSMPLWGAYPVLAWGMSLERPIMAKLKVNDMRSLYTNDLEWLRNTEIKD